MNTTATEPSATFVRPASTVDSLRFLRQVEARYPVDRWTAGSLHVWPLIRYDLCNRNYFLMKRSGAAVARSGLDAVRGRVDGLRRQWQAWLKARVTDSAHEARVRRADVLLYSDGASFARVNGSWVDLFCDPLVELVAERGLSALVITPTNAAADYVPRHRSSALIQPSIDLQAQLAAARARLRPTAPRLELEGYDELVDTLHRELPGIEVTERERIRRMAVYVETFAGMYRRLLERVTPRAVLVVCYYGSERMALLRAASQLGIPTADIQHGAASTHWAYADWTRVPAAGYDLLPNFFWCWDRATTEAVDAWSGPHRHRHRSVHGGNPFLDQWKDGTAGFVREHDTRMRDLVRPHEGKEQVLLTANGLETEDEVRSIVELIRSNGDRIHWWLRMHPTRRHLAGDFEAALRRAGATSWLVHEATDAPLYGLLRFMDFHVTETSSTIIEAAQMGVPSVFTTPDDAGLFEALVDEGWALPVADMAAAPAGLETQRERRPGLRARQAERRRSEGDARSALSVILEAT